VSAVFDELTADANRKKIAVTTSDGTTQCYVEIERWDDANEEAELWVKIPSISFSSATDIYLYFDVSQDDNDTYVGDIGSTPGKTVWDSNFTGIYHMCQDPSGGASCILDSTDNANHGTPYGTMTSGDLVDGSIGKGLDFDGNDDHIQISGALLDPALCTISLLSKGTVSDKIYIGRGDGGESVATNTVEIKATDSNELTYFYETGSGTNHSYSVSTTIDPLDGSWHLIHMVIYTNGCDLWIDDEKHVISTGNSDTTAPYAWIGYYRSDVYEDQSWKGQLDEVQISDIKRSEAWIKATHYSHRDTFLTFNDEVENFNIQCDEDLPFLEIENRFGLTTSSDLPFFDDVDSRFALRTDSYVPFVELESRFGIDGDADLPFLDIDSAIYQYIFVEGEADLPFLSIESSIKQGVLVGCVRDLPFITASSRFGFLGDAEIPFLEIETNLLTWRNIEGESEIPFFDDTVSRFGMIGDAEIPFMTCETTIVSGRNIQTNEDLPFITAASRFAIKGDANLPFLSIDTNVLSGRNIECDSDLPFITSDSRFAIKCDSYVPFITAEATITVGVVIACDSDIPFIDCDSNVMVQPVITCDSDIPFISIDATISNPYIITADEYMPYMTCECRLYNGKNIQTDAYLPFLDIDSLIYEEPNLVCDEYLPFLNISSLIHVDRRFDTNILQYSRSATGF